MFTTVTMANWKGSDCRINLTARTAIGGGNGSGKTKVLDAIAFVLSKFTSLGKKPSATAEMGDPSQILSVSLFDVANNVMLETIQKKDKAFSQATFFNGVKMDGKNEIDPAAMGFNVPVEAIHPDVFLGMSGEARAKFLFGEVATACMVKKGDFTWFSSETPLAYDSVLTQIETRLSRNDDEHKRNLCKVQGLTGQTQGQGVSMTRTEIDTESAKLTEEVGKLSQSMGKQLEMEKNARGIMDAKTRIMDQLALTKDHIAKSTKIMIDAANNHGKVLEKIQAETAKLQAFGDSGDCSADIQEAKIKIKNIRDRMAILAKNKKCPICDTPTENLAAWLDGQDWELAEFDQVVKQLETAHELFLQKQAAEIVLKTLNGVEKDLRLQGEQEKIAIKSYAKTQEYQEKELKELETRAQETASFDSSKVAAQLQGMKTRLDELKSLYKASLQSDTLKEEKIKSEETRAKLENDIKSDKEKIKDLKKFRNEFLSKSIGFIQDPYRAAIEIGFPGCKGFFEVSMGAKVAIDFGITRGEKDICYDTLSGGERLIVLAALVAVIQKAKIGRVALGLFEMAEADEERLKSFSKICNALGYEQVIIAGHGLAKGGYAHLEGLWSVVDMGAIK